MLRNRRMEGKSLVMPETVDEIFNDFEGRRAGLIKAFIDDIEEFHSQFDPERANDIYLLGLPNGTWEVVAPVQKTVLRTPEPVVGLNHARDQLGRKDWLSLVAAHGDSWLLAMAFYFGACAGLTRDERDRLFNQMNKHPTLFQVVKRAYEPLKKAGGGSMPSKSKKVPASKVRDEARDDEEVELDICGVCKQSNEVTEEFWICCDYCDEWFHGRCVDMNAVKADSVKLYMCPLCCKKDKKARI